MKCVQLKKIHFRVFVVIETRFIANKMSLFIFNNTFIQSNEKCVSSKTKDSLFVSSEENSMKSRKIYNLIFKDSPIAMNS